MGFYNINFNQQIFNLLSPKKRKAVNFAWLKVFSRWLQFWNDNVYIDFSDGCNYATYISTSPYLKGTIVQNILGASKDNGIYKALENIIAGELPGVSSKWFKINNDYIGVSERIRYNSRKVVFEWALNRRFKGVFSYTPNASEIYITRNIVDTTAFYWGYDDTESSYFYVDNSVDTAQFFGLDPGFSVISDHYTINVKNSIWLLLGPDATTREGVVRAFADQYNILGIKYSVINY